MAKIGSLHLAISGSVYLTADNITNISNYALITGTAGCGKSTLFKHLFLDALKIGEYIPIMFELRNLNNTEDSLIDALYQNFSTRKFALDKSHFLKALSSGKILLMLDAFDEVDSCKRMKTAKEIIAIVEKYDQTHYLVSSRPDDQISSWLEAFSEFKVSPLTKPQAIKVI